MYIKPFNVEAEESQYINSMNNNQVPYCQTPQSLKREEDLKLQYEGF